jgi:TM2 domain-containing membrane protein YozV
MTAHKNKTLATLLGLLLGGVGAHRFYLRGAVDRLGLLHLCTVPMCGLIYGTQPQADWFFKILPLLVSYIVGFIETFIIGLSPDAKFDAQYNAASGRENNSRWPLVLMLVAMMFLAATTTIGTIARLFDLLYTGGAYG